MFYINRYLSGFDRWMLMAANKYTDAEILSLIAQPNSSVESNVKHESYQQINRFVTCAVRYGYLNIVKWLYASKNNNFQYIFNPFPSWINEACEYGHRSIVKWAHKVLHVQPTHQQLATVLAIGGWMHEFNMLANYVKSRKCAKDYTDLINHVLGSVCRVGKIRNLKWLLDHKYLPQMDHYLFRELTISGGHIHVLEFLKKRGLQFPKNSDPILDVMIHCPRIDLAKWFLNEGYPIIGDDVFYHETLCEAVASGKIEIVKWLCSQGYQLHEGIFDSAIYYTIAKSKSDDMSLLEWLWENKCPYGEDPMNHAVDISLYGNINPRVAIWLMNRNVPIDADQMEMLIEMIETSKISIDRDYPQVLIDEIAIRTQHKKRKVSNI